MAQAGSIWVKLGLKLDDFNKNMSKFEKDMNRLGSKISGIGSKLTQGFTLPIIATGAAAVKSADEIDKAFAKIRIGTGATGKQLKALEDNFANVFKDVPLSADAVSTAIAELNTRTGNTGKTLEKLAKQMLNLSKIQETDINQTISNSTRLFGDWSVATDDQTKAMDKLFRISQQTGPTVDRIGQLMVQYGAPLRQMGFGFEQTAMLMGQFEKQGVNTELVMSSMRQGLAKFAKAGEEPVIALKRIMDEIKNTASIATANVKAIEIFGARSGPDMAAAIREGRFELENLKKSLAGSHDTINQAADDSLNFGDKLQKLTNRLQATFEPLGTTLIDAIDKMMPTIEKVIGVIENMVKSFTNLPKGMQNIILAFVALSAAIGPIGFAIGKVISAFGGLTGAINLVVPTLAKLAGGMTTLSALSPVLAAKLTALKVVLMTPLGQVGLIAGLIALGVAIEKPLQKLEKSIDSFYAKTFPKLKKIWEFGSKEQITGKFSDWEGTAGVMPKSEAFKAKEVSNAKIKAKREENKKLAELNKIAKEEEIRQAKAAAEVKKMLDEQEAKRQKQIIKDIAADMKIRMKALADAVKTPMQLLTSEFDELMKKFKGTSAEKAIKAWYGAAKADIQVKQQEDISKKLADISFSAMKDGKEKELALLNRMQAEELKGYESNEKVKTALSAKYSAMRKDIESKYKKIEDKKLTEKNAEAAKELAEAWKNTKQAISDAANTLDSKFLKSLSKIADFKDQLSSLQTFAKGFADNFGKTDFTSILNMTGNFMNMLGSAQVIFQGVTSIVDKLIKRSDYGAKIMTQFKANADAVSESIQKLGASEKYAALQQYGLFKTEDILRLLEYRRALEHYITFSDTASKDLLNSIKGTWGFSAEQLQAFSDYAVEAGQSADYFLAIFSKSLGNLNVADFNAINSVIADMSSKIGELKDSIVEMLGIDPGKISQSLSGAFGEVDLAGFKANIYDAIDTTTRNAVIAGFMSGTAMKAIYQQLSDGIFEAVQDGVLTATELTSIRGVAEQLEGPMVAMYQALDAIGLGVKQNVEDVSSTISDVVEGINLSGVFNATDLSGLASNLKDTVMQSVRQGLINASLQSEALKPLIDNLNATISGALEFGGISDIEMGNIKSSYEALLGPMETIFNRLNELGLGFEGLSGTTSQLNNTLAQTESTLNAPSGFSVAGYRAAAVMPGNQPITGQVSVNGNSFTIVANNPQELFEQLQKLQTSANVNNTGNPVNTGGLYGTGG
jgi:hypothetical protein